MNDTLTATSDPFASSLAGRKLGRYEVLSRLASGGMAGVYVARALGVAGFERLFAIKVLHPHLAHEEEFISMFLDEARLAAKIRHPNVVPTIDISDTPDAGFYLVMEYIEGDHLGALLQKAWKLGKRLPFPVTLRIIVDALEGLAAAHNLTDEAGRHLQLVHRDISPHNIMVSTDGVARITDFGVAKAEVRLSTTREGQFKGKLAYMAPEHASNGDADQRSDLFSMAIILWESLAGRRLFRAENHAATLNKICLEPIPLLSSADPALAPFDDLLAKALSRDPNQRFQTAEEFAEAVEEAAPLLGGLAKAREVAQLVREYAAEKIAHDAQLIRSAIAQLAASGGASEPPPAYEQPVVELPLHAPPAMHPGSAMGMAAVPPVVVPPPAVVPEVDLADIGMEELVEGGGRRWLWAGLLVALAAALGATAAWLSRGQEPSLRPDSHVQMPVASQPKPSTPPNPIIEKPAVPTSSIGTTSGSNPTKPAANAAQTASPVETTAPGRAPNAHETSRGAEAAQENRWTHESARHQHAEPTEPPHTPDTHAGSRQQAEPVTATPAVEPPSTPAAPPVRREPRRTREDSSSKPLPSPDELLPNPYH